MMKSARVISLLLALAMLTSMASLLVMGFSEILHTATEPQTREAPKDDLCVEAADPEGPQIHENYINGMDETRFCPNRSITRAETAQLLYNLMPELPVEENRFSDVREGSWYAEAVKALGNAGIIHGYEDEVGELTFRPNRYISRAELVQLLYRVSGQMVAATAAFSDVPETYWAAEAITAAQCFGWVRGYEDGTFRPNRQTTRAEAVAIINRFLGRKADRDAVASDETLRFFTDVQPGAWYYYDIYEAAGNHIAVYSEGRETWTEVTPQPVSLQPGFRRIEDRLYLIDDDGFFLHHAGTGSYHGTDYRCDGPDGAITILSKYVTLIDGRKYAVENGILLTRPGPCEFDDSLICITDEGDMLCGGYWNLLYFNKEGKYTSGNADIDDYVNAVFDEVIEDGMTKRQKLRACYDYVFEHVYYLGISHVERGAAPSTWAEDYMLRLMERGRGNCYSYASELFYLACRLGYNARPISGAMRSTTDHAWVEIEQAGLKYVCDPQQDSAYYYPTSGRLFMKTYNQTPWEYILE